MLDWDLFLFSFLCLHRKLLASVQLADQCYTNYYGKINVWMPFKKITEPPLSLSFDVMLSKRLRSSKGRHLDFNLKSSFECAVSRAYWGAIPLVSTFPCILSLHNTIQSLATARIKWFPKYLQVKSYCSFCLLYIYWLCSYALFVLFVNHACAVHLCKKEWKCQVHCITSIYQKFMLLV